MTSKKTRAVAGDNTVYQVKFPQQKLFNSATGQWELQDLYSTPVWVKYGGEMTVQGGIATTTNAQVAMEVLDAGAEVTPDPRPYLQEQAAKELEANAEANPNKLYELKKYVDDTNEWREEHNLPPLSVLAPDVPRPLSALLMPNPHL